MALQEKERLIQRILDLEAEVYRALRPAMPAELLHSDLTMPQLKVLLLLFRDGPARMTEVAAGLGVTLATATGIIDRLVERGLVTREGLPDDRRVVLCRLSEDGHKLVARLWELSQDRGRRLLDNLTVPQLELVAQAIEVILGAAAARENGRPQTAILGPEGEAGCQE